MPRFDLPAKHTCTQQATSSGKNAVQVLVIGATGYVGSHVADHLARHGHCVIGHARNESSAAKIRIAGHSTHVSDLADHASLIALARQVDATVFAPQLHADDEHIAVAALLRGYRKTGKTFVFTSGTGVLGQRTAGEWSEDCFAEDDPFVPPRSIARRVETENLVRAAAAADVRSAVVRPPMIWGDGRHLIIEFIEESIRVTGAACYIGRGLNLYSHVHIDDLADVFRRVIERGRAGALYHAVGGELNNRCIAELLAKREGCDTRSISIDQAIELWGKFASLIVLGASSRSRSPRARQELGWTPLRLDLIDAILRNDLS
jgi:nucleoside-diphosphate-sugar epimerase